MKKSNLLSKAEMKKVMGGNDEDDWDEGLFGSCTVTITCFSGTVLSCSSANGKCKHRDDSLSRYGYVRCDSDPKNSCQND